MVRIPVIETIPVIKKTGGINSLSAEWLPTSGFLTEDELYYFTSEDGLYYFIQE